MLGKRASGEPPQANLINDIKQKRLPVFLGNTTTLYECTARSVDNERRVIFSAFFSHFVERGIVY